MEKVNCYEDYSNNFMIEIVLCVDTKAELPRTQVVYIYINLILPCAWLIDDVE